MKNLGSDHLSPILADRIDLETKASAIDYTRAKMRFARVGESTSAVTLSLYLLFGVPGWVADQLGTGSTLISGYILVLLFGGAAFLIDTTLSAYRRFSIEKRFGFNRSTPRLFLSDRSKSAILNAGILFPIVVGVLFIMQISDEWWWVTVWLFSIAFGAAVSLLYPLIIAPMFNRFTPLPEGELRERLIQLAKRLNFPVAKLFVMDGSKRSGHSNAYFTGIGAGRRIVLYDTLISRLDTREVEAVLAHEIGHRKLGHVRKRMFASVISLLVLLFLVHVLRGFTPMFLAFGYSGPTDSGLLILLMFCSAPFLFFLLPISSYWSRTHEFAADRFAVRALNDSKSLQSALVSISSESLSNPTPHPLYARFYYSHPALAERLEAMDRAW